MKSLTLSHLGLAGILVLGLAVVWIGTAPSVTSAESILGGDDPFGPTDPGGCCTTHGTGACEDADTSPTSGISLDCDAGGDAIYCIGNDDGNDTCQTNGDIPCQKASDALSPCNTTQDMPCGG